jgi:hypothetical protein
LAAAFPLSGEGFGAGAGGAVESVGLAFASAVGAGTGGGGGGGAGADTAGKPARNFSSLYFAFVRSAITGRLSGGEVLRVGRGFRIGVVPAGAGPITPGLDGIACAEPEDHCQNDEPVHRAPGEMGCTHLHDR